MTGQAPLHGKTALITGGARRLGRACALALADRGAHVVVHYHQSETDAASLCDTIAAAGGRADRVQGDLSDPESPARVFDAAVAAAGPLDILLNNASIYEPSRLADVTRADLVRNLDLHAFAPLELARRFAAQGRPGVIVNVLDARPVARVPTHAAYILSKALLRSLTELMAVDFAPAVRVNAIAPGAILLPEGADPDQARRLAEANLMGRLGEETDITEALLYLVSAGFVTGQVLTVDGGYHLGGDDHA